METDVQIPIGDIELEGAFAIPDVPTGLVIFAHGSGSGRFSPRNRYVAARLNERGFATLLFDLLTTDEERLEALDTTLRFDVDLLAERLIAATDSVVANGGIGGLPIGYFGASAGAAAALIAAERRPERIAAVVARGGRPDLASYALPRVRAPTLFIVGGDDAAVVQANRQAALQMTAPTDVAVLYGAGQLFEEPGALDEVARLAGTWFLQYLGARITGRYLPATSPITRSQL
jgi:putative phosphoribosyl transferase